MRKVGENTFRKIVPFVSLVLLGITALFVYQVRDVRFDYDFEKFYPADDEDTKFFMDFRERFKSDNDFLLIAIKSENGAFDKKFLQRIDTLTKSIEKSKLVDFVLSPANQQEFFLLQGGATASKPYINFDDYDAKRDSTRMFKNKELVNTLISENGNSVGLYVKHEDFISKKKSDKLIQEILGKCEALGFEDPVMGGRTIGQKYYIDVMSYEMLLFLSLSALLVVVFLAIAFRSIWGILVPQVVILTGMLWVVGGMGLFNEPLNIILTTLPSIMFVVSMSDSIHLVSRYLDALRTGLTPYESIMISLREVGLAIFLTSLTTAVGFLTLYFVQVQPIQIFGVVMGIGVMVAFVLTFLILPILFYYFPGPKYVRQKAKDHFWKKYLEKWFRWIIRNPKKILAITVIVSVIGVGGALMIVSNNYLMDDISPGEKLKQDFAFIDSEYGGVRPFTVAVTLADTSQSMWDEEVLRELDTVQTYLEDSFGVQIRSSLVSALKVMNRGAHLGNPDYFQLPESKNKLRSFRRNLRIARGGEVIRTMLDTTERYTLISGTCGDIGNNEFKRRNARFQEFLKTRPKNLGLQYRMTGSAYLVDKNISYLAESMVQGLGLSIIIVALIMGWVYRSLRVMIISLIPNLIPLVVIAGIMGYFGIELKTSTAIIFTISFGIAVDDTIHYLGKFKYELLKGKGKLYALKRAYLTTGKAMILTTLVLCSGFLLLVLSSFMGTFYMGILLCITLFVALIADLTVLPALLLLFYKSPKLKKEIK